MRRLSWLLDQSLRIPGTRWRFGLDGLIGLVPGVGDAAGTVLSLVIFWQSYAVHLPLATRARMLGNIGLDALVGLVPVLGDILDVAYRANRRNLTLVIQALESRQQRSPEPRLQRWAGALLPLLFVVAIVLVGFGLFRWLAAWL
ncbi:MAG: DUF4112 domain-containing protein [Pseudomonadota bacterium]